MTTASDRQFGEPRPGLVYDNRPSAFGLALRGERLALVRVTAPGRAPYLDLPGGGIDPGESEAEALVREFGEETGLVVEPGRVVTRASQFMIDAKGAPHNSRSAFFEARLVAEDPALKIEDDHVLEWIEPQEALKRLRHDSHAWAVAAWLRSGR